MSERIHVQKLVPGGQFGSLGVIHRVVWRTFPGAAVGESEVSAVYARREHYWCRFNGERRHVFKERGQFVLRLGMGEQTPPRVMW